MPSESSTCKPPNMPLTTNKELLKYAENETNALIKNIATLNANSYAEKEEQLTSYANTPAT
jgi:hypothetical protein